MNTDTRSIRKIDPKKVINEVARALNNISKLYGYKIPDNEEALLLTKFVVENFPYVSPHEIEKAFAMVAMNKLNVEIKSYGRILIVPILTAVISEYQKQRQLSQRKTTRAVDPKKKLIAAIEARLLFLNELEEEGLKFSFLHYDIIDNYVERFSDARKIEVFKDEKEKHLNKIKSAKPISRDEMRTIKSILQDDKQIDYQVKIESKIRLAREYASNEIIDYEGAERRIRSNQPLPYNK